MPRGFGVYPRVTWTEREEEILRDLYPLGSRPTLEEALASRTWQGINSHADRLGLKWNNQRFEERPIVLTPYAVGWIEAAIDGEGTVGMARVRDSPSRAVSGHSHQRGFYYNPRVSVTNTSRDFIEKLVCVSGLGRVRTERRVLPSGKNVYSWYLVRNDTLRLLRAVNLVIKKPQQTLLIEAMELMRQWGKNRWTVTEDYERRLAEIHDAIRTLNRGKRHD